MIKKLYETAKGLNISDFGVVKAEVYNDSKCRNVFRLKDNLNSLYKV